MKEKLHNLKDKYTADEWNNEVVTKIENGIYKDISDELPDSFLYPNQIMRALVLDDNGIKWYCNAWTSDKDIAIIDCKKAE